MAGAAAGMAMAAGGQLMGSVIHEAAGAIEQHNEHVFQNEFQQRSFQYTTQLSNQQYAQNVAYQNQFGVGKALEEYKDAGLPGFLAFQGGSGMVNQNNDVPGMLFGNSGFNPYGSPRPGFNQTDFTGLAYQQFYGAGAAGRTSATGPNDASTRNISVQTNTLYNRTFGTNTEAIPNQGTKETGTQATSWTLAASKPNPYGRTTVSTQAGFPSAQDEYANVWSAHSAATPGNTSIGTSSSSPASTSFAGTPYSASTPVTAPAEEFAYEEIQRRERQEDLTLTKKETVYDIRMASAKISASYINRLILSLEGVYSSFQAPPQPGKVSHTLEEFVEEWLNGAHGFIPVDTIVNKYNIARRSVVPFMDRLNYPGTKLTQFGYSRPNTEYLDTDTAALLFCMVSTSYEELNRYDYQGMLDEVFYPRAGMTPKSEMWHGTYDQTALIAVKAIYSYYHKINAAGKPDMETPFIGPELEVVEEQIPIVSKEEREGCIPSSGGALLAQGHMDKHVCPHGKKITMENFRDTAVVARNLCLDCEYEDITDDEYEGWYETGAERD